MRCRFLPLAVLHPRLIHIAALFSLVLLRLRVGLLPFLDQRHFLVDFLQQRAGLRRRAHHLGTEEDQQFGAFDGFVPFAENVFQERDAAQNGGFVAGIAELLLDDAAQDEGFAGFGGEFGAELGGVNHHLVLDLLRRQWWRIRCGCAGHVAGVVDVRLDFDDDPDIPVIEALWNCPRWHGFSVPVSIGTAWPTKSLPMSLSEMVICGSEMTVASAFCCRNWMRKSMLMVLSSTPERRLVRAWATEAAELVPPALTGLLTWVLLPKPFR